MRHAVMTLEGAAAYPPNLPVVMDWTPTDGIYFRSYSGRQVLVGDTGDGERLREADVRQADVPLDHVAEIGAALGRRMPAFAEAGLARSWTGVYDVTPDWNPVLGPLPGIDGLHVAFGFSGHGFKLSPMSGASSRNRRSESCRTCPLAPYSIERFAGGPTPRRRLRRERRRVAHHDRRTDGQGEISRPREPWRKSNVP